MAHPVFWPAKTFFYAIGNTPATCLTSELPPEQPADILLLGCGDVRSVLYTVYSDLAPRQLDFTCCDFDPAVLARNVLLYTLLSDLPSNHASSEEHIEQLWNFYYHFFIDKKTLDMVLNQCQLLIDLSADFITWNNSRYGTFLRFCSMDTLSALRKYWTFYIETKNFSKAEKDALRSEFHTDDYGPDNQSSLNLTSVRAAGPLWMKLNDVGSRQFNRYWKTGVTFDDSDKVAAANEINPSYAFHSMGKGFALHYGSDPILSFHLARALAPIKGSDSNDNVTISRLVKSSMDEFKSWCLAFNGRTKMKQGFLTIRFFVGDALAFCRALHYCAVNNSIDPGLYSMPWSSRLIKLDGGDYAGNTSNHAPLQFSVIDTSNLTDHLGLLNILVASRPLMQRRPSSIIYTNTLLPSNDEGMVRDGFLDLLCGDVSMMSMILDLIPISYVSNFTSHSNVHETMALTIPTAASPYKQFHENISWRIGSMSDLASIEQEYQADQRLKFDETQLATFLHGVYLKMFSEENLGTMLRSKFSLKDMKKYTLVHYTRFSFAYLLRLVKDNVHINWHAFIYQLHDRIGYDRTFLIGSNSLQDLFCSLHLLGVESFQTFSPDYPDLKKMKEGLLKGWKDIPPVVCITLRVPRKSFKILENTSAREIGTPILHCSVIGEGTFHNIFNHYQCFFGNLTANYGGDEPSVSFEEDPAGFRGRSSVIVTFLVPTWTLGADPSTKVALSVRSDPRTIAKFLPTLGPYLSLFSAQLTDRKYVHITRERPGNSGELEKLRRISFSFKRSISSDVQLLSNAVKVTLDDNCRHVSLLTRRANMVDSKAKESLVDKAAVEICQVSPQTMSIAIGKWHLQLMPFPFPINSADSKTRIARKSAYVEVDVKVSSPLQKFGMSLMPFPVIKQNKILSLWNIHYIDLERLPILDQSSAAKLEFVKAHVTMSLSDRERRLCEAEVENRLNESDLDVFTRLKQSIVHLFTNSCGLGEIHKCPAVGLSDPDNGGIYTLIFFNDVCLDMSSHTIVLDTCILPLTHELLPRLTNGIPKLHEAGLVQVLTRPDEVRVWQHLLPAFTERCRKWTHTDNCEYLSKGIPVSVQMEESPLCSCGQGKNLGSFGRKKGWKAFAPYATRAAISPLFAVPFVDTIGVDVLDALNRKAKNKEECAKCAGAGKPKLLFCAACKNISYCSVECQRADWKVHKKSCKKV